MSNEALGAYKKAIEMYRRIDDSIGLATAYSNVSVVYLELKQDSTALPFALRALDIREQSGEKHNLSISHTNLGNIYSNLRDSIQALDHYSKTLNIYFELYDSVGISMAYTNIGILYYEGGSYKNAIPFLKKSIFLDSTLGDEFNLMISRFNLGEALFGLKKYDAALKEYKLSYEISSRLKSASYLFDNGKPMASCYYALGQQIEAYEILSALIPKYDSLFSDERKAALLELQRGFEVYKIDLENKLLRKSNNQKNATISNLNFTEKAFYLGLGFALITILILIIGLRRINYLNRSLRTKNSLIEEQNLALTSQTNHLQESIRQNQNLVSLMVHDLKNPLAQVGSLAQLPIDDEVKDLIGRASQNGLDLIYDIMEVTHAESGELKLDKQQISIHELLTELAEEQLKAAENKNIKIILNEDPSIKRITSDKRILKRIFSNLVSNSIKFSGRDRHVFISSMDLGDRIQFSVKDEGPGFKPSDRPKLFRKYQKLSARPTAQESSTGLGLAMAKIFTNLLGGDIDLNESYNRGAEFILRFPKV